ncbi:MAG: 23S rRNA (uracil(1939)-C(5))-methyltransferase RlmD [Erysipelothrix sp.]
MNKNEHYQVEIIDLTYEGFGVAKVDGFPVFIENTIPGEVVEITILKVTKRFAFGKVLSWIKESEHRVEVTDAVGTRTGTMPLQHLSYTEQLKFKKDLVIKTLSKEVSLEDVTIHDTLGMDNPWNYRNKAQIPVREINGQLETGFYKKASHDLIPIENYHIQDSKIDEAIIIVRDILRQNNVKAYDEEHHRGNIRHIIVRRSELRNEIMIILVTKESKQLSQNIVKEITKEIPECVSIVQNINDKRTNVIMGNKQILLFGEDRYHDILLGKTFSISSRSFFQVNTHQTEVLYSKAIELAGVTSEDVVVDAYCGIGSISLNLADHAKHVYAMEIVEDAIVMAKENASNNNITNVTFEAGKAEEIMPRWVKEGLSIDTLVVDPPRKGLDINFIEASVKSNPERIVYVSCNPATLARDLKLYQERGYELKEVCPVDMFPQTVHVETIALLNKENKLNL